LFNQEFNFQNILKQESSEITIPIHYQSRIKQDFQFLDAHASLYLLVPVCLPGCLAACLSQLALGKDDINAHPLRPMSYWFSSYQARLDLLEKAHQNRDKSFDTKTLEIKNFKQVLLFSESFSLSKLSLLFSLVRVQIQIQNSSLDQG
jgi:hypothetical protein